MAYGWAESPALLVGTTGDYPPFTERLADDSYQGTDITAAKALAATLHASVVFVPTTWATWVTDLNADRFDIAMGGINVTPQRKREVLFSTSYKRDGKIPITKCSRIQQYSKASQINHHHTRLITNLGGTNEQLAHQRFPKATLVIYPNNLTVFEALEGNAADVMVTDASEAHFQAMQRPSLCVGKHYFTHSQHAYAVARTNPSLQHSVNRWLKSYPRQ
jgi:cyclohexadienyl dehydratase